MYQPYHRTIVSKIVKLLAVRLSFGKKEEMSHFIMHIKVEKIEGVNFLIGIYHHVESSNDESSD